MGAFGIVSLLYETRCNLGLIGAISEKSLCHEVMSDIFATNAPRPPNGTLNSCFREYHSVWVHLGMFRYYTKLGASWAETGAISEKSSCHEVV